MGTPRSRHPLYCILPPHILTNIARNGTPRDRDIALTALEHDHTRRGERAARSLMERPQIGFAQTQPGPHKDRLILDCQHNTQTPPAWPLLRQEGQDPVADQSANRAYDWLGHTFDLFWGAYHRNSIDDLGRTLKAGVHYGNQVDNAFYDGSFMLFGDGDGALFNDFTIPIDVTAHELTHGVTECEANLIYQNQPGALNESMSDVFGSLVKQWSKKQSVDKADWLIGAGLFTPKVHGKALRSMSHPGTAYDDPVIGKDPQPEDMAHYVTTTADDGGVHINSGIPNRAFYLVAKAIDTYAWQKAGLIWYETLCDHPTLRQNASFLQFANLTVRHARLRFGNGSREHKAVHQAWRTVGVPVTPILAEEFDQQAVAVAAGG